MQSTRCARIVLYGQHIPLGARIIAAADAYDAMTSDRPYRKALSVEEALRELERQKGQQFDPVAAEALIEIDKWLQAREPVILFERAGEARAYPLQILIWHENANDAVAGIAVTFAGQSHSPSLER